MVDHLLRELLGDAHVDHLLGLTDDAGQRVGAASATRIRPDDRDLLDLLGELRLSLADGAVALLAILGAHDDDAETSRANAIRVRHGGSLPSPSDPDPLVEALLVIARDVLPVTLPLSRPEDRPVSVIVVPELPGVPLSVVDAHPRAVAAADVLRKDPAGRVASSPWSLLNAAAMYMVAYAGAQSFEAFFSAVRKCVVDVRRIAAGERVTAPTLLGFDGFGLPEEVVVETAWGAVRATTPAQEALLDGQRVSRFGRRRATATLLAEEPVRLTALGAPAHLVAGTIAFESTLDGKAPGWTSAIVGLPLAAMLATARPSKVAPAYVWAVSLQPAMDGYSTSATVAQRWGGDFAVLSAEEQASLASFSVRVASVDISDIELAARRVLRAIGERMDPQDALVDAVVAWENLVGAESEVSFRVVATLAHLLEPDDPGERRKLLKRLRTIYEARSKVVHGSRSFRGDARELADSAIDVAVKALSGLFERFPELLNEPRRDLALLVGPAADAAPGAPDR